MAMPHTGQPTVICNAHSADPRDCPCQKTESGRPGSAAVATVGGSTPWASSWTPGPVPIQRVCLGCQGWVLRMAA
eukprot:scaffold185_cov321-Prasinococcus_capsulatus_cf.AAC.8